MFHVRIFLQDQKITYNYRLSRRFRILLVCFTSSLLFTPFTPYCPSALLPQFHRPPPNHPNSALCTKNGLLARHLALDWSERWNSLLRFYRAPARTCFVDNDEFLQYLERSEKRSKIVKRNEHKIVTCAKISTDESKENIRQCSKEMIWRYTHPPALKIRFTRCSKN